MPQGYGAYALVVTNAESDEAALPACQKIQYEDPQTRPDQWDKNEHGPLHVAVGRRWDATIQWLLPHCDPNRRDSAQRTVWDLCYMGDKYWTISRPFEPSIDTAKLLTASHDPRVMCQSIKDGEGDIPLYEIGASWEVTNTCSHRPHWYQKFAELDAFFLAECKRWQDETGKGVTDFPIL